jgi:hypothetical protein
VENVLVGICPECYQVFLIKKRAIVVECEECGATIATRQAVQYLHDLCEDPAGANKVLDMILQLEEAKKVEEAVALVDLLYEFHQFDEKVAFTWVRISGYDSNKVRRYLETFSQVGGEKLWARDLLDCTLGMQNMVFVPLFTKYIENKVPANRKREYKERLEVIRAEYTSGKRDNEDGLGSLYAILSVSSAINVAFIGLFFWWDLMFILNVVITAVVMTVEFFAVFFHNQIYGNRIGIGNTERIFLCVYLASIPIAIAGALIAWLA